MDSMETMGLLLERAGLKLSSGEVERLKPFFEKYQERLKALYAADLGAEEVAGVFLPQGPAREGSGS